MNRIRLARENDLWRIAEIEVFNYRLNFYPIFQSDEYYFDELQVMKRVDQLREATGSLWVYDDGVIKAFMQTDDHEIRKLFVEPVLQGRGIGAELIDYAINRLGARWLWALEKNEKAIAFYKRHGFVMTDEKKLEEDTSEYLVRLKR